MTLPNQTLQTPDGTRFSFQATPSSDYRVAVTGPDNCTTVHFLSVEMATHLTFSLMTKNATMVKL
jgi:hypothetical protein